MTDHPITLTPELVAKIRKEALLRLGFGDQLDYENQLVIAAYRAGADQELDACCEWLQDPDLNVDTYKLRAARRPKPPSLAEEALEALKVEDDARPVRSWEEGERFDTIRRALERLQELEGQSDD